MICSREMRLNRPMKVVNSSKNQHITKVAKLAYKLNLNKNDG